MAKAIEKEKKDEQRILWLNSVIKFFIPGVQKRCLMFRS